MKDTTNIRADVTLNYQKLEEVTSVKFVGATLSNDGTSTSEVRVRLSMDTAAMVRLSRLWT
ncbi:hypothetical protein DPMN_062370 [Dreissena polymorpha]|uniref:Uncharacterized protein n=1 Tax=Dreissena polymorpha TaxID=45954 RepID=A0A9D4C9Q2_DREPO|nr:hypothetical protein DPMN_062370 [Dreissena polymorpha]